MRGVSVAGEAGLLAGDTVLGSWTARVVFLVMDRREMSVACDFSLAANRFPTTHPPTDNMAAELAEARRIPLFNASVLTNLIYFPYSRKSMDKMIQILQNEPLFGKKEKYARRGRLTDVDCS